MVVWAQLPGNLAREPTQPALRVAGQTAEYGKTYDHICPPIANRIASFFTKGPDCRGL
jgi:hypothetical protein